LKRASALASTLAVLTAGLPVWAQAAASHQQGRYSALNALPDWGGIWFLEGGERAPLPPLKGSYLAARKAWEQEVRSNNGVVKIKGSNCLPRGMPGIMALSQYPYEFLFTPGRVTINQEAWMQTRRIWTDGRSHPADPNPSFMGDSVGRWEGDALVIETVAISTVSDLAPGVEHSEKLRVTERIQLNPKDRNQLVNRITVEDPDALERSYTTSATYRRDADGRLLEFQCAENDRNRVDAEGNTTFQAGDDK